MKKTRFPFLRAAIRSPQTSSCIIGCMTEHCIFSFSLPDTMRTLTAGISTSGWIRLGLPDGEGATVDFTTQSGRLKGDIPWERVGDLYVFGDRTCSITAETTSGDLEIN